MSNLITLWVIFYELESKLATLVVTHYNLFKMSFMCKEHDTLQIHGIHWRPVLRMSCTFGLTLTTGIRLCSRETIIIGPLRKSFPTNRTKKANKCAWFTKICEEVLIKDNYLNQRFLHFSLLFLTSLHQPFQREIISLSNLKVVRL